MVSIVFAFPVKKLSGCDSVANCNGNMFSKVRTVFLIS